MPVTKSRRVGSLPLLGTGIFIHSDEAASGLEVFDLATALSALDANSSVAESSFLTFIFDALESGAGIDSSKASQLISGTDTGSDSEIAQITQIIWTVLDSGSGIDTATRNAAIAALESGLGSDAGILSTLLIFFDNGSGLDNANVIQPVVIGIAYLIKARQPNFKTTNHWMFSEPFSRVIGGIQLAEDITFITGGDSGTASAESGARFTPGTPARVLRGRETISSDPIRTNF